MKKTIFILISILTILLSACESSVVNKVGDVGLAPMLKDGPARTTPPIQPPEPMVQPKKIPKQESLPKTETKQSKESCKSTAESLLEANNPFFVVEKGDIIITFTENTNLEEAKDMLRANKLTLVEVMNILPIVKRGSEEQVFNNHRMVKASTSESDIVEFMCNLLEKEVVNTVMLSTHVDASKIAQMAQQQ